MGKVVCPHTARGHQPPATEAALTYGHFRRLNIPGIKKCYAKTHTNQKLRQFCPNLAGHRQWRRNRQHRAPRSSAHPEQRCWPPGLCWSHRSQKELSIQKLKQLLVPPLLLSRSSERSSFSQKRCHDVKVAPH